MARKTLGLTHLLWVCQQCETRNLGTQKICTTCGKPQPEDVHFIQGDREELLQLQDAAKKSADIHCPYCGTRNSASAQICSQCGGKLAGGTKRQGGRIVGAFKGDQAKGVTCPSCKHENAPNAPRCAQCGSSLKKDEPKSTAKSTKGDGGSLWLVIGLVVVIVGFLIFKGCSRSTDVGVVSRTAWTRTVAVEQFVSVTYENWWDEIPAEAYVTGCEERYRYSSDEAKEDAIEVCGTPYTVDTGTGMGEVVMDCEYKVYDTYCEYEVSEWAVVEYVESDGYGLSASWPVVAAYSDQRAGERKEVYTIWFDTENGSAEFKTTDYGLYQSARNGSEWELTYDGFGKIRSAKPR